MSKMGSGSAFFFSFGVNKRLEEKKKKSYSAKEQLLANGPNETIMLGKKVKCCLGQK